MHRHTLTNAASPPHTHKHAQTPDSYRRKRNLEINELFYDEFPKLSQK